MATILTVGTYTYDNITTKFNLNWTESVENGQHKLAYSIVTSQSPSGSGYKRTVKSGTLKIAGQSISIGSISVSNGTTVKSGTVYTTQDTFTTSLSLNVGGETKSASKTVNLTPISNPVYFKETNYSEYVGYVKDTNYSEVTFMVKENGSWGEY